MAAAPAAAAIPHGESPFPGTASDHGTVPFVRGAPVASKSAAPQKTSVDAAAARALGAREEDTADVTPPARAASIDDLRAFASESASVASLTPPIGAGGVGTAAAAPIDALPAPAAAEPAIARNDDATNIVAAEVIPAPPKFAESTAASAASAAVALASAIG